MEYSNGGPWTPYHSHTWSRGHSKPLRGSQHLHRPQRPRLVRHSSVEDQSGGSEEQGGGGVGGFNLSILDLQTLRRDSNAFYQPSNEIRQPTQDVFRVHRPRYHISSEKIWFPRPPDPFEVPEAATTTASDDTTLESEEVEIKLPCRSVSINVVGMPSGHEVTSSSLLRPFEVTNHCNFKECNLLVPKSYETTTAASSSSSPPKTNFVVSNNTLQARTTANINNKKRPTKLSLHNGIQCDEKLWKQDKLSPCCRYRRPVIVSLISVGFLMIVTFLVLYWNYYENIHRRMTKKQGFVLDHWGKGSPSAAETAILDIEVEILKQEEEAKLRKMNNLPMSTEATLNLDEDLLMIGDGNENLFDNLNGDTTTMPPMDTRVD